jgi:hypothetical protein
MVEINAFIASLIIMKVSLFVYMLMICLFFKPTLILCKAKRFLSYNFDMKDMSEANVILGTKVLRDNNCITLYQLHYVEKMIKRFEYFDYSPMSTPYDSKIHLVKNHGDSVLQKKYAQIIGSLMFLTNYTRPDIAYTN